MSDDDLRNDFERDGFIVLEWFLTAEEMAEIESRIDAYIRDVVPSLPPGRVFREDGPDGAIKSMSRMDEEDPYWSEFKHNPKILSLVSRVLGVPKGEIVCENLQYFGKPAFEGSVTPWHQDNGFQQYDPPDSLMTWLALRDVDEDMGCVVFAKGSHKLGTVRHVNSGVLGFSQTVETPPDPNEFPEVMSVMSRGGISLHHCNTFHRSGPNKTERPRPAISVNYRSTRAIADLEARERIKHEVARLVETAANGAM